MHDISDSIHQLFSELLDISRSSGPISFESNHYNVGNGFKLNNNGEKELHPNNQIGLLGFSHPLNIKTSLIAAALPEYYSSEEATNNLISEVELFFSKLAGFDLYINIPKADSASAESPGRYDRCLSKQDYKKLALNDLNIDFVFPFSFSLSKNKKEQKLQHLTNSQILFSKALLRLLSLGQFYDRSSLIKLRSEKLEKKLSSFEFISCTEGLTFKISSSFDLVKLKSKGLHCSSHTLTLPLFYDENSIDELISILQEEYKCL